MTDHDTDSASKRHWLTNDGLAVLLTVTFIGYVYAPLTPLVDGYPETNPLVLGAFVTAFGVAVAWAFGRDAVEAWRGGTDEA